MDETKNMSLEELIAKRKEIDRMIRTIKKEKIHTKSCGAKFGWTETNTRYRRREWRVWLNACYSGYCTDSMGGYRVIISAETKEQAIQSIPKAISELTELYELVTEGTET